MREEARITDAARRDPYRPQRRHCPCTSVSTPEGIERLRSSGQWAHSHQWSTSKATVVEEAGKFGVDAFNTVQERLSQDEPTAEQEVKRKQIWTKSWQYSKLYRSRSRKDENITTVEVLFSPKGSFFNTKPHDTTNRRNRNAE